PERISSTEKNAHGALFRTTPLPARKKRGRSPPPRTTPDPQGSTMSANTPSRPRRAAAAGLGALALGAALTAAPASAADEHAAEHAAEVWLTTADGEQALERQPDAPFTGDPLPIDIAVDPGERGRPFTGAGASVTEASAHLISGLPEQERDALLTDLFSAESGIGLDYLRQPFGSTDFNAGDFYTYEDVPGEFGIDRDRAEIIPVLHDA